MPGDRTTATASAKVRRATLAQQPVLATARVGNEGVLRAFGMGDSSDPGKWTAQALYDECMSMIFALGEAQSIHASTRRAQWINALSNQMLPRLEALESGGSVHAAAYVLLSHLQTIKSEVMIAHAGWLAVDLQYKAEHERLVGLRTADAMRAARELETTYAEVKRRLEHIGERSEKRLVNRQWVNSTITREDYLILESMLKQGTHISVGALEGSRERVGELIEMLDTVADERRRGANADRTILGWQQQVWAEVRELDGRIGPDTKSNAAAPFVALRHDLVSKLIQTLQAHPREYSVAENVTLMVIGAGKTVVDNFIESAREALDVGQFYLYVQSIGLYRPHYVSEVGQALEQGASIADVLKAMVMNLIETPARLLAAVARQDFLAIGEELANLHDLIHTVRALPHLKNELAHRQVQLHRATRIMKARTIAMKPREWQLTRQMQPGMHAMTPDGPGQSGGGKPPTPPGTPPSGGGHSPTPRKEIGPITLRVDDTSFVLGTAYLDGPTLFIDSFYLQFSGAGGLHGLANKLLEFIGEHGEVTTLRLRGYFTDAQLGARYANEAGMFDITVPATADGLTRITAALKKNHPAEPSASATPRPAEPQLLPQPAHAPQGPLGTMRPLVAMMSAEPMLLQAISFAHERMLEKYDLLDPQHKSLTTWPEGYPPKPHLDPDIARVSAHVGPASLASYLEKQLGIPRSRIYFADVRNLDPALPSHVVVVCEVATGQFYLLDPAVGEILSTVLESFQQRRTEGGRALGHALIDSGMTRLDDITADLYMLHLSGWQSKPVRLADFIKPEYRWDQNPPAALFAEPTSRGKLDENQGFVPQDTREAHLYRREHQVEIGELSVDLGQGTDRQIPLTAFAWFNTNEIFIENIRVAAQGLGERELNTLGDVVASLIERSREDKREVLTVRLRRHPSEQEADSLGDFEITIPASTDGIDSLLQFIRGRLRGRQ